MPEAGQLCTVSPRALSTDFGVAASIFDRLKPFGVLQHQWQCAGGCATNPQSAPFQAPSPSPPAPQGLSCCCLAHNFSQPAVSCQPYKDVSQRFSFGCNLPRQPPSCRCFPVCLVMGLAVCKSGGDGRGVGESHPAPFAGHTESSAGLLMGSRAWQLPPASARLVLSHPIIFLSN